VSQGAADLAAIPLVDAQQGSSTELAPATKIFLAFMKNTLGDAVAEVRASERLTDSAVCLVAPDSGPDRALEKLLVGSGRLNTASKPILEVNPRHALVVALAELGEGERALKEDATYLLFDEARVLEGERPADARAFSERLARVLGKCVGKGA
jgi:molecular chaperone HtpG